MAGTRALARELRPVVAELAGAVREAGGHARDDRVAAPRSHARMESSEGSSGAGAGVGLHGCSGSASSADRGSVGTLPANASGAGFAGTLRTSLAGVERLRRVARDGAVMSQHAQPLEHASVRQYCKAVRLPVISANFARLAEQTVKENRSHIGYLEALLAMESEERDRRAIAHRLHEAKLPQIPAAKIRELAEGGYITRAEPVVLIGDCGTGKTHLATGLCVAAC